MIVRENDIVKTNQIKLGVILSYIAIFVNNIIGIFYTPVMIKYMGDSEYGLYSIVASIVSILTILDFGFGNAIVVYTARYKAQKDEQKQKKLYGMFIIIYTVIGIICSIIGLTIFCNVDTLFGSSMTDMELEKAKIIMLILTFNVAVTFPLSVFSSIITAYEKFVFLKVVNIIRAIAMPLIMYPLLITGYRSITMSIVVTVLNLIVLFVNMLYAITRLNIHIKFGKFDMKLLKEISIYSFFIFLSMVIDKVNWQLDTFLLGAIIGTAAVTVYNIAMQFNNIYMSFSNAISELLLPRIAQVIGNGQKPDNDEEVTGIFIKVGRIQYIILALVFSGFIIYGKEFIQMLYGDNYANAYYIALILIGALLIPSIENVGIKILQAKNKHKFRTILYLIMAILNILISIALIKQFGEIGAAIGTAISMVIGHVIIMNIYYYKVIKINIKNFAKEIMRMSVPVIIVLILGMLIKWIIPLSNYISLAIQIIIYIIIYCILMGLIGMNKYEKQLIKEIIHK